MVFSSWFKAQSLKPTFLPVNLDKSLANPVSKTLRSQLTPPKNKDCYCNCEGLYLVYSA
jgi:hypothetical protein